MEHAGLIKIAKEMQNPLRQFMGIASSLRRETTINPKGEIPNLGIPYIIYGESDGILLSDLEKPIYPLKNKTRDKLRVLFEQLQEKLIEKEDMFFNRLKGDKGTIVLEIRREYDLECFSYISVPDFDTKVRFAACTTLALIEGRL